MTTADAAAILGMRRETITAYCQAGRINATRTPGHAGTWDVPQAEVDRMQAERLEAGIKTPSTDPAYRQLVALARSTTPARACYALRVIVRDVLSEDEQAKHMAFILGREGLR